MDLLWCVIVTLIKLSILHSIYCDFSLSQVPSNHIRRDCNTSSPELFFHDWVTRSMPPNSLFLGQVNRRTLRR